MPSGKKVGFYQGLNAAVDGFLESFYAARRFKQESKDKENAITLQALQYQLQDETMPMAQRAKILDEIQRVAQGGKLKGPKFSDMLDLESLEKIGEQKQTKENPAQVQNGIARGISQEMNGELPPEMLGAPASERPIVPIMKKRGELSPFQLKQIQKEGLEGAEDERAIRRAKRIAEIQEEVKLQADIKRENELGFKVVDRYYDKDNNYHLVYANGKGEQKDNNLGQVTSEKFRIAGGKSDRPSSVVNNLKLMYQSQGFSEEEALDKALEDYGKGFKTGQATKEENLKRTENINRGTTPRTPEQIKKDQEDDDKLIRETLDANRKDTADFNATFQTVKTLEQQKNAAYDARDKAQAELKKLLDQGYNQSDDNVSAAQRVFEARNNEAIKLQREFDAAVAANEEAFSRMNSRAEDLLMSPHKDKFIIEKNKAGAWKIKRNPNYKPNSSISSTSENADFSAPENATGPITNKDVAIISAQGEDPAVREYANRYFRGDYQKALAAIASQR